jgi:hypothetical protein
MKTIVGMLGVVLTLGLMAGIVAAEDDGGWIVDSAAPLLVMSATQSSITVENWGTAPANVGGLRLITQNGNVGTDVAKMPYTVQLRPEPFPTKGAQNNDYKITVATNQNLTKGDTVYLTNGVGTYATAVVA